MESKKIEAPEKTIVWKNSVPIINEGSNGPPYWGIKYRIGDILSTWKEIEDTLSKEGKTLIEEAYMQDGRIHYITEHPNPNYDKQLAEYEASKQDDVSRQIKELEEQLSQLKLRQLENKNEHPKTTS